MFWKKNKETNNNNITKINKKIIIIGGGLSGLISGIHCLLKGMDVTLIEKNSQLGGKLAIPKHEDYPYLIYNKTKFTDLLNEINISITLNNHLILDNITSNYNDFIKFLYDNSIDDDNTINQFCDELLRQINNKKPNNKYEKISIKDYVLSFNSETIKNKLLSLLPNDLSVSVLYKYLSLYLKGEIALYDSSITNKIINKYTELGGKYLLNKEVEKFTFDKKNIVSNVILKDNSIIEGDYFISAIDPNYTLSVLLNNKFTYVLNLLYKDYMNYKMDYRISFLFAINKPFEYNNISVLSNELKVNSSKVDYITFKKSQNNKYIYCEIYQNYDDYDYLKIIIDKGSLYQEAKKKLIKEIIDIFNNNFKDYKITYKDIVTLLDVNKNYNSFRGTYNAFLETPKNSKINGTCNIKNLKNVFLCSPVLLYTGGITNSLLIGKQSVKILEEAIKNEKEEEI